MLKAARPLPVDVEPAVPETVPVGAQIRDLRKARGMTLQELAGEIGRSVGYVSQIERNLSVVTIPVLGEIAVALGVSINWFFQGAAAAPAEERDVVVRRGNRRRLDFTGSGMIEELLSPTLTGSFEMILGTFEPGGETAPETYSRPGEIGAFVVSGTLKVLIGGREFLLEAGDAITFPTGASHRSWNPGDVETSVLWVLAPPSY